MTTFTAQQSKVRPAFQGQFVQEGSHVAMMDDRGNWRLVPSNSRNFPVAVRMTISPQVAKKILEEKNVNNRNLDHRQVKRYVSDMISGRWKLHGNSIQFDQNGRLIDGQHRLKATLDSGLPMDFMVSFGIDPEAVIAIDEGRRRSNLDVSKISGREDSSKSAISTACYLLEEKGIKQSLGRGQILEFADTHKEAINFVVSRLTSRGLTKSPIWAALTRAYYSHQNNPHDLARLERFIDLLQRQPDELIGMDLKPEDNAPLVLSSFVLRSAGKNTGPFRKELYDKTKAAIWNYMRRIPISRLYGIAEEKYPLPGEQ